MMIEKSNNNIIIIYKYTNTIIIIMIIIISCNIEKDENIWNLIIEIKIKCFQNKFK